MGAWESAVEGAEGGPVAQGNAGENGSVLHFGPCVGVPEILAPHLVHPDSQGALGVNEVI